MNASLKPHADLVLVADHFDKLIIHLLGLILLLDVVWVLVDSKWGLPHVSQFHGTRAVDEGDALVVFPNLDLLVLLLI